MIADRVNQRIRRVTAAGIISTVAGTGVAGFSGDGVPGTTAQINAPIGVAIASDGARADRRHPQPSHPPGRG